jgi:hypothetical protein
VIRAILLAGMISALAAPAAAQSDDTTPVLAVGIPAALAAGFSLGLGIADLVSYGIDSPWDDGWAVVDVVIGTVTLVAGAVLIGTGLVDRPDSNRYGPGVFAVAWGAHLLGHGIWSLLTNDEAPDVELEVAPGEGGARFVLTGTL